MHCGAGASGSRLSPGWRSAAAIVGAVAVLALGAAAAAYAALNQSSPKPKTPVDTVAQTPPSTSSTTTTTTTDTTSSAASTLPGTKSKPPKIPSETSTPTHSESTSSATKSTSEDTTTSTTKSAKEGTTDKKGEASECESTSTTAQSTVSTSSSTQTTTTQTTSSEEAQERKEAREDEEAECEATKQAKQAPILLDTDAASNYNPNGYPEAGFGDPNLAIDGEATTAWTVAVAPSLAPKVQAGLLLDLKASREIAKLVLITKTPGMTIEIYGTSERKAPTSLSESGWRQLSSAHIAKKRDASITLKHTPKIRQLLIWVISAPAGTSSEATEAAAINEVDLYEPR